MAWPFKPKALKTPFAKELFAVREYWEQRVVDHEGIEEPNRIAVLSASAAATVALGAFGSFLIEGTKEMEVMLPLPDGGERPDRIVQFARSLDDGHGVEDAYRVATWAFIADLGAYFWRPNYEVEMYDCAEAFEFRNVYEGEVPALADVSGDASDEGEAERLKLLTDGTLTCMVSASLDEQVDPDDWTISMHLPAWIEQFFEGRGVANERLKQLAPQGLPIWKDED